MTLKRWLKSLAMGLTVALLFLGLVEGAVRLAGALRGESYQIPPPMPRGQDFQALCPADEGRLRLCSDPSGDPRRIHAITFTKVPERPRITVIGESFVHGLNLSYEQAWPARMGAHLGEGYEVLNFGRCGSESSSLVRMVAASVEVGASLIVLAVGNNEYTMSPYYGGLAGRHPLAFQNIAEALSKSHLFGLLKRRLGPSFMATTVNRPGDSDNPWQKYVDSLHGRPARMDVFPNKIADPDVTEYLEETKRLSERFYALRMEQMVRYAEANGVKVVLSTMPRALTDPPPLLSGIHHSTRAAIEPLVLRLRRLSADQKRVAFGGTAEVKALLEEGLKLDPQVSAFQHMRGMRLLEAGDTAGAIAAFYEGIQWDLVPDSTPKINEIIRDLAKEHDLPLIELTQVAEAHVGNPWDIWRDAVHANAPGAEIIGAFVANELTTQGLLPR